MGGTVLEAVLGLSVSCGSLVLRRATCLEACTGAGMADLSLLILQHRLHAQADRQELRCNAVACPIPFGVAVIAGVQVTDQLKMPHRGMHRKWQLKCAQGSKTFSKMTQELHSRVLTFWHLLLQSAIRLHC